MLSGLRHPKPPQGFHTGPVFFFFFFFFFPQPTSSRHWNHQRDDHHRPTSPAHRHRHRPNCLSLSVSGWNVALLMAFACKAIIYRGVEAGGRLGRSMVDRGVLLTTRHSRLSGHQSVPALLGGCSRVYLMPGRPQDVEEQRLPTTPACPASAWQTHNHVNPSLDVVLADF